MYKLEVGFKMYAVHRAVQSNLTRTSKFSAISYFFVAREGEIPEKSMMSVIRANRFNWPKEKSLEMGGSARMSEIAMGKLMADK